MRGTDGGGTAAVTVAARIAVVVAALLGGGAASAAEIVIGPVPAGERERLRLAPVHVQYVRAAEGIPVVASERVAPQALAEAAWLLDRMLARRPDVARAIARSPVRFVVMAHDEFTTDVPEHADLEPRARWDRRARGLGATLARPAVSCGEENLLCFPGDPYATENILIHEFGHVIHEIGLATADPTFEPRLRAAFDAAREHDRWTNTYARSSLAEYWAEGVQSWFSCNRVNDREHGEVNSSAQVREHDPPLAALLEEVFGPEPWAYVRPHDRAAADRAHVAGFDRAAAPTFDWANLPDREPAPPPAAGEPARPVPGEPAAPVPAARPAPAAGAPPRAAAPFDAAQAAAHQRAWADHAGAPVTVTNSVGMSFVLVPAGEFTMGSPADEPRRLPEETPHRVALTRPFFMAACEVTQGQWEKLIGENPAYWSPAGYKRKRGKDVDTSRFPVERVAWYQAQEFCAKLSALPEEKAAGRVYRLPTEAEWEFACRAGTETPYHFGAVHDGSLANSFGGAPYGVEKKGPYLNRPCDVGSYPANAFGIHDMHGNMWEWCADGYASDAYTTTAAEDPRGPEEAEARVIRGGAWRFSCDYCRAAVRHGYDPRIRAYDVGFRVAFDVPAGDAPESATAAGVVVDLDAARLPAGEVRRCTAGGSAAATFTAGGGDAVTVAEVAGRRAVTFAGGDWLVSTFIAPAAVTGRSGFTVAAWVFNPQVGGEETILHWARRGADARAAQFGYGTAPSHGAIMHWGEADMGWEGGVPVAGAWHHLAVTHSGGADGEERLYVDGRQVATERKALDLWPGERIHVGQAPGGPGFTGSIASLRMDAAALGPEEIAALARGEAVRGEPLVLLDAAALAAGPLMEWANAGSAGGAFTRASVPRVAEVAGRPALVLEGPQRLVADAPLAAPAGAGPFTLEAWVWNPEVGNAETFAAFTAPQVEPVLFGCGRSALDGGFSGSGASLAFAAPPAAAAWHHVAVVSAGAAGGVALYLDGELEARADAVVTLPAAARLAVGGGGRRGFTGALGRLRLHDMALDQATLRRGAGLLHAFAPEPPSGATVATRAPALRWRPGTDAARHVVSLAKDRAAVEARDPAARAADLPAATGTLAAPEGDIGGTYHWCVDQLDAAGAVVAPGVVWTYAVDDGRARRPAPRDRTANTPVADVVLAWEPGPFATGQRVFFGTDEAEVTAGSGAPLVELSATARSCPVPGPLAPGTRHFWRVETLNGAAAPSPGVTWAFRTQDAPLPDDVTFFVVTDTHYTPEPASWTGTRAVIDAMNWLPGTPYPAAIGGTVGTPRGVLHGGDMLDSGAAPSAAAVWKVFTEDFGVNGEGRVCYPVYEITGNHDAGDGSPPQEGVRARNRLRRGLAAVSDDGLHYAWDWDHVHFVALNKFSGSGPDPRRPFNQAWNDPRASLEFLAADLRSRAGAGKPVILLQHYGFDDFSAGWGWWSEHDRAATWDAIRDSNVVAYLHGHTHAMTFMKWRGEEIHGPGRSQPSQGIDVIGCGSGQRGPDAPGEFMVFHVTRDAVTVAHRFVDRWGETLRIPIPAAARWPRPSPAATVPDGGAALPDPATSPVPVLP